MYLTESCYIWPHLWWLHIKNDIRKVIPSLSIYDKFAWYRETELEAVGKFAQELR